MEALLAVILARAALAPSRAPLAAAAVAALGVVGYGVALVFLLFGAPDLAMTQFADRDAERAPLRARALPPAALRARSPRRSVHERATPPCRGSGGLWSSLVLVRHAPSRRIAHLDVLRRSTASRRPRTQRRQRDPRGLPRADTLGEITVLALAALGILRSEAAPRARDAKDERPMTLA